MRVRLQQEVVGTVLQQPLALGYLVSTAPLRGMPAWWWAGCAHLRDACPAFLKNALHLHLGNVQAADDFTSFTQRRDHNAHPLDSQTTTDVLRYRPPPPASTRPLAYLIRRAVNHLKLKLVMNLQLTEM